MRMTFEQVALEDIRIFTSPGNIEDAWYGYIAMLDAFGWTHIEYINELLKRIDRGWVVEPLSEGWNVRAQTQQ